MGNWETYRLGDVVDIKNGKSRPKNEGNFPVYGGNGILYYSDKFNVKGDTIIIGRVGAYCGATYFEKRKIWVSDNALYAKTVLGFDSSFIYYLLKSKNLNQHAGGSSHPLLTQSRLNDIEISIPPLQKQKEISSILSSLDDKIELNNQINQNLEALAQSLFKHWFIDFEFPDENGNPYKSSGGKMVDSELGVIPEGWEVVQFGDFVDHLKETIKPYNYPGIFFDHYSLPAFDQGYYPIKEQGDSISSNKFKVFQNSILVSKLNPRFPRIWPIGEVNENLSVSSTEFQVFKPKKETYYSFSYLAISSKFGIEQMVSMASGTSGSHQRVSPKDILKIKICKPPERLIEKFHSAIKDNFFKIRANIDENRRLENLRDTLLPKLILGEVSVNQAEKEMSYG